MKIKKARRGLGEYAKKLDREKMDEFLAALKFPLWVRFAALFRESVALNYQKKQVEKFLKTHLPALKRSIKGAARTIQAN